MSEPRHPRIFLSHSHFEKETAGTIKKELDKLGCKCFVAHEDIVPTKVFEDEILKNLRECDALLALLTENFAKSNWTDQETGIAIALNKLVVGVKMGIDPYGFIGKYHAAKWDFEEPELSAKKLALLLVDHDLLTLDNLILGFSNSYSYDDAGRNSAIITSGFKFSKQQMNSE